MAENYKEANAKRVNELYDEIKNSLDVIYDGLTRDKEGELAAREMDQIVKNLDYLMNFALAGAKANVDGPDKLLKSEEEES